MIRLEEVSFFIKKEHEGGFVYSVIIPVLNVMVCGGGVWDIIVITVKRRFHRMSFSIL